MLISLGSLLYQKKYQEKLTDRHVLHRITVMTLWLMEDEYLRRNQLNSHDLMLTEDFKMIPGEGVTAVVKGRNVRAGNLKLMGENAALRMNLLQRSANIWKCCF